MDPESSFRTAETVSAHDLLLSQDDSEESYN